MTAGPGSPGGTEVLPATDHPLLLFWVSEHGKTAAPIENFDSNPVLFWFSYMFLEPYCKQGTQLGTLVRKWAPQLDGPGNS